MIHLEEELKPLIEKNCELDLGSKLLLIKSLEGITKWLKLMI